MKDKELKKIKVKYLRAIVTLRQITILSVTNKEIDLGLLAFRTLKKLGEVEGLLG